MALVRCSKCGCRVSNQVPECPVCSNPVEVGVLTPSSLSKRLGGAVIDNLSLVLSVFVAAIVMSAIGIRQPLYAAGAAWILCLGVNAFLLWRGGQTVGKVVAGTRIVDTQGNTPRPVVLILRYLLQHASYFVISVSTLASLLGLMLLFRMQATSTQILTLALAFAAVRMVSVVFSLFDVLFIFSGSRRCLHDLIVGTRVIDD